MKRMLALDGPLSVFRRIFIRHVSCGGLFCDQTDRFFADGWAET